MDAIVWEGSGAPWRGATWGDPVTTRLRALGWRTRTVRWGDSGLAQRGRPDVVHVLTGGMESATSDSDALLDRLRAVEAAVLAAAEGRAAVLGICLGAQLIARAAAGTSPRPAAGGGEAGVTTVRACRPGVDDLTVATAHVEEIPPAFLAGPGVTHLWAGESTRVQGFRLGQGVVGVQFHPELSGAEAARAARPFRRDRGARPALGDATAVDPIAALGAVLTLAAGREAAAPTPAAEPA